MSGDIKTLNGIEIERVFHRLVADWKAARGHVASINKWVRLPEYRQIIELGREHKDEVVSLLLTELEERLDHWFWALKELTGVNPVAAEDRGDVPAMAACWVRWGREHGFKQTVETYE